MLKRLHLTNVGPAPEMRMDLASRLNLITGDNGLGKSFLLDVAWWALTRKWPQELNDGLSSGYPARPTDLERPATISFGVQGQTTVSEHESVYVPTGQAWLGEEERPSNPGLVIYVFADGGFAVWDPARNYSRNYWKLKKQNSETKEKPLNSKELEQKKLPNREDDKNLKKIVQLIGGLPEEPSSIPPDNILFLLRTLSNTLDKLKFEPIKDSIGLSSEISQERIILQKNPPAFVFNPKEVWDGLRVSIDGKQTQVCNGLLADWASWIREKGTDAERMAAVLALLAPAASGDGALEPGQEFERLSVNDSRDIPTVQMGYGKPVPILYASFGVRRIAALAYMLSWAWREHVIASKQLGMPPSSRVVLLFDEIEAHLHPRWQRRIVPALIEVMRTLTNDESASVQLIGTTHAPLVMASVEPLFDEETDKLFSLDLSDGVVSLNELAWAKQGDVINWLVSDSFGLRQARSLEAERAIEAAEAWMRQDFASLPADLATQEAIHAELQRVLAGHDPFWPRWIVTCDKRGGRA
jgi:hypothetical protein